MIINMTHGSGGQATSELIRDVFAAHLGNSFLNRMEDAAVLPLDNKHQRLAYTTDSFVVTPLIFKGGDIGRLAICGTVNDLLAMGTVPLALSAGFIIEEGMDTVLLQRIVISMAEALKEAGTKIVAADTKVIEGRGGLYINTSGVGYVREGLEIGASQIKPGDGLIVSGTLGDHHACILSHRMEIDNDIESDAAPLNGMVEALISHNIRIHAMRDITRGGLATILNELCEASQVSALIDHKALPVKESVRGLCGILGLDPLYMGNEGKMLFAIHPEDVNKALDIIKTAPYGQSAAFIGHVKEGKGVYLTTDTGSLRTLPVLFGEGLPRIC